MYGFYKLYNVTFLTLRLLYTKAGLVIICCCKFGEQVGGTNKLTLVCAINLAPP